MATTPSTLRSELVFRTRTRGLEPGPRHWNNSRRVGLGFGEKWGCLQGCQGIPVDISLSRSGRCGPPQGCQGVLGDSLPLSVPTDHRLGMFLLGGRGFGHVFVQCPDWLHRKQGLGGSLKFQSGMTWPGLILIVAAKKAYLAFLSQLFFLLASFSLLLNTLKAISRRSLWGVSGPFSSWRSFP